MSPAGLRPAVFLDRDGTLIREVGYLCRPEQIELLDGAAAALRALRAAGFAAVVVTNQSAVARGWLGEAALGEIHRVFQDRLAEQGARLDGIYYCPHHPSEGSGAYRVDCACRKPNPGMVLRAAQELGLDPKFSYVVGDQPVDHELAVRVGAIPVMVRSNGERSLVDGVATPFANIEIVAQWIVGQSRAPTTSVTP